MAVTIKKAALWRKEIEHRSGELASTLEPLMAAIEVSPITGRKAIAAAKQSGLAASTIPGLLVEGDDKPGLGYAIASALGAANISLNFVVAQVIGRRYSAVFGFESEADAAQAARLIKKVTPPRKSR